MMFPCQKKYNHSRSSPPTQHCSMMEETTEPEHRMRPGRGRRRCFASMGPPTSSSSLASSAPLQSTRTDGDGEKNPAHLNQLRSVRGLNLQLILGECLYNGVAASARASEHGTQPSSREAIARPSSDKRRTFFK
jgi:hypothetical protein